MAFPRFFKTRDKPGKTENMVSSAPNFYFGSSGSGKAVTVRSSIQMTTVYACVRVIAETVASLPLHVYERTATGSQKALKHTLYHVLHDEPNAEMTSFVWRETMLTHLLLWGNAYCQIVRNGRGAVSGLYPLLPENMTVDRGADGQLTYTYRTTDGKQAVLTPEDVLHIPGLGFDGIMGYSPIALEKNAVGLGIAAEEYGSKFFANGATPSGVLQHPNVVKDPARVRDSWQAAYGGASNSHKVAVLEEGMSFKPISIPNNEAQFLETRKFQVSEICRIFRVPPHLVGDLEHATFSNIEHQSISFGVHTIRPWLTRLEQAMNKALFTASEKNRYYVCFNMDGLLRGDYKSRMEGYAIARQNGWMSANDIRELENLNPLPAECGGDTYLVNGNMVSITPSDAADRQRTLQLERANLEMEAARLANESAKAQAEFDRESMDAQRRTIVEVSDLTVRRSRAEVEQLEAQTENTVKTLEQTNKHIEETANMSVERMQLELAQLSAQVSMLLMQLELQQTTQEAAVRAGEVTGELIEEAADRVEEGLDEGVTDSELAAALLGEEPPAEATETESTETTEVVETEGTEEPMPEETETVVETETVTDEGKSPASDTGGKPRKRKRYRR